MATLDSKIPEGPLKDKWTNHKNKINLVNPANKRLIDVIVVGTGLAGGAAAASLAEMGYNVKAFCYQDSPRRAHSIAAQGGINAAKNYQNDGDSTYRLFYDTVKGGDYRAREANVYRLAEVSANIIDQCVAQGVPFAREYGGLLDNRSFGGVLVSRTFYAKGQTGQQLLLGAYSALSRQIGKGKVQMFGRHEMLDLVVIDGKARGIIARNMITGKLKPTQIKDEDRDYYLERRYPAFGNLVPRDVASRAAKERCDAGYGVNQTGEAVYLDFKSAIHRYGKEKALVEGIENPSEAEIIKLGEQVVEAKYGNLFQMYYKITDENPYKTPMKIYPAVHYTMGGIWVDYNLMTTIPGCYAAGEANFSDHGANRLGASALMQGLADGYFVLPYTVGDYLANEIRTGRISTDLPEFVAAEKSVQDQIDKLMNIKGTKSVDHFHKQLGKVMWDKVGMARNEKGLKEAMEEIRKIREEFWKDVRIPGVANGLNPELEKAGRVADFLELGELFAKDALHRTESCGGHFREESVELDGPQQGEAKRDDANFTYVAAWEWTGDPKDSNLHKEELKFENIELKQRSYK